MIEQGLELGDAMDNMLNDHNTKQKSGSVGYFTNGLITRETSFKNAGYLSTSTFFTQ